jgi:hypothetical protein
MVLWNGAGTSLEWLISLPARSAAFPLIAFDGVAPGRGYPGAAMKAHNKRATRFQRQSGTIAGSSSRLASAAGTAMTNTEESS